MRVKSGNIIGEISDIQDDSLTIMYTDNPVAGWNLQNKFKKITKNKSQCLALDQGLNSSWVLDVEEFINSIEGVDNKI